MANLYSFLAGLLLCCHSLFAYGAMNYENEWKKVTEFESKSLPKSALEQVDRIYKQAKAEKKTGELVKAVIHKLKFQSQIEEDAVVKNIIALEKEVTEAEFPAKPLLHSMLAESYWRYYQNNRYRFRQRSVTTEFNPTDIRTWDLKRLVEKTVTHYQASLQDTEKLQRTSIEVYDEVINKGYRSREFRPTLYDFLAHRAVDFFSGEEPGLTRPTEQFLLLGKEYLSPAKEFAQLDIRTADTLAYQFQAVRIFKELLRFHLNDKDPTALVDVDLKRLAFVKARSVHEQKNRLYLDALEKIQRDYIKHPASTQITFAIASDFHTEGQKYNPRQSEDYKWESNKAFELCGQAITRFPGSDGALNCRGLQATITLKNVGLTLEQTNLPDVPFRALVAYQNIDRLYFRIVRTNHDELKSLERRKDDDADKYRERLIDYFAKKKAQEEFSINLPNDKDFQQHYVEAKIPSLPLGEYIILAGTDPNFSYNKNAVAYDLTTISNIAYIQRNNAKKQSYEFYVLHRGTGQPLSGVTARVWLENYDSKRSRYEYLDGGTFTSDRDGFFEIPAGSQHRSFLLELNHGKDQLFSDEPRLDGYSSGRSASLYLNQKQAQSPPVIRVKTFFFTDRAIYRPGQTIYFKGVVLNSDEEKKHTIKPNYRLPVFLFDVNGQKVAELSLTSNEYGTVSGTFTAPSSGLTGQMTIRDGHGNTLAFSVEDYKRPKFEAKFDPVKGSYRLGNKVTVQGNAKSYSGANIDNAAVNYRVVRQASFPYWWFCFRGYYPQSPSKEIVSGTTKTDENGEFKINFIALADLSVPKESQPTFAYTVYADVVDINGETRSTSTTTRVGYNALALSLQIPELIDKQEKSDAKNQWIISSNNLAGEFEPATVNVAVYKLKSPIKAFRDRKWERPDRFLLSREEFYRTFPNDPYEEENNYFKWDREDKVFETSFTTAKDKPLKLDGNNRWKAGKYLVEVQAKDKYGQPVKEVRYFTLYNTADTAVPFPTVDWYAPLKINGEPGERARILAGSDTTSEVLYEVEQYAKIIERRWLKVNKQQRLLELPITEAMRGNISVHTTFIRDNRLYTHSQTITVPYTNKQLDISFETFRDKLQPGAKEQWKLRIKNNKDGDKQGDKIAAEMVASLYDASLDTFRAHAWAFDIYNSYYATLSWQADNFKVSQAQLYQREWNTSPGGSPVYFDMLNWFGFDKGYYYYRNRSVAKAMPPAPVASSAPAGVVAGRGQRFDDGMFGQDAPAEERASTEVTKSKKESSLLRDEPKQAESQRQAQGQSGDLGQVKARTNFNETAFFYPHLQTEADGSVVIAFTIPEALTRWKMLGFAHTKDLKYGFIQKELITQKELMVVPNAPRFFREGDKIAFSAKISNLTDKVLSGTAQLLVFDALTMKPIDVSLNNTIAPKKFEVKKGQSTALSWSLDIPAGIQAVTYRVVAKAGNFSDGEEMTLPVLSNRILVTESLPLPMRGTQTKTFSFDKLLNNQSTTLKNHKLTLEYTANPAWYVVQALPYLIEFPHECAEQLFSRFYANSIATHIANSNPQIKKVFDSWRNATPDALLSSLEKNEELKSLMLEETPWVREGKNETERKRRVAVLFDINRMSNEMERALNKLAKMQGGNGAWPWFVGMPEDRYITQHIVTGLGHLDHLGVKSIRQDAKAWGMTQKAVAYLDAQINRDYEELKRLAKAKKIDLADRHIGSLQIHYLYARSYFEDIKISAANSEAFKYFKDQAAKYWTGNGHYLEGMIALALHRYDDKAVPVQIIKSLKERALNSEELGMYWKADGAGYYWYQAPIETQALMIEVFDEVARDTKAVDDLKVWLLKQKQTQDWKTTKATAEASYALLLRGTNWLTEDAAVEITLGEQKIDPKKLDDVKVEAGTGYFKTSWAGADIKREMGKVSITKKSTGVAWGALYWQYFEQLDKITPHDTPLKLQKQLFLQKNSANGPVITPVAQNTVLRPGDLLKVRIELRVDRNMEYVHMKDLRASGLEPINVISQYKYQDGLHYYESTRDAATHFFFGALPKGTYVFEYPLRVTHTGDFSNGITTIQSMYAPEFTSHSQGTRLRVN